MQYEAYLRASCFTTGTDKNTIPFLSSSLRESSTRLPTRVLSNISLSQIPLSLLFIRTSDEPRGVDLRPVFEDCFDGHDEWIRGLFARVKKGGADKWEAIMRQRRLETIRERLILFASITLIFIITLVLTITVFRHHRAVQLAVAFAGAVLIHALMLLAFRYALGDWRNRSTMRLLNVLILGELYTWGIAAFMLSTVPHTDRITMGLGITGGAVLILWGAGFLFCACITPRPWVM